jgi:hypothetical protein
MKTPHVFMYACKSVDVGFNARDPAGRARGAWGVSQHADVERRTVPRYGIGGARQGKLYKEHARNEAQYPGGELFRMACQGVADRAHTIYRCDDWVREFFVEDPSDRVPERACDVRTTNNPWHTGREIRC